MNYLQQLEKSVMFIEDNLGEGIRVEDVGAVAGYSYYHFQRIFEAVLGESIGDYIRTRRLARAAGDLIYTDRRILDIAVDYQFESQEAFNRAFKKVYRVSPGVYRRNRIDTIIGSRQELTASHLRHICKGVTLCPAICWLEDKELIGMRVQTSLRKNTLKEEWGRFLSRSEEIENRAEGSAVYGICEVSPDFDTASFDADTESTHFIGAEVYSFGGLPEGMSEKTLRGGRYAVFTHKGKVETLKITYDYIWGTWLLCSGLEIDSRDDFERYDGRFLGADNGLSEIDIFIPIKDQ